MDDDELRRLCFDLRRDERFTDDEVLDEIDRNVEHIKAVRRSSPSIVPPADIIERLWLLGWLIYESSWDQIRLAESRFESAEPGARERGMKALRNTRRVAEAYRQLPWPEYAPRGLGAIRAVALVSSKKDTEQGYDEAWELHEQARDRYESFAESLRNAPKRNELALDETLIQLALAETGTACRTAERIIGRWAEGVEDGEWSETDEERWVQRLFTDLSNGIEIGERALRIANEIRREHGLVDAVDDERMALDTARRNPGIMTARAALLAYPLCSEMERIGRRPQGDFTSWAEHEADLLRIFEDAYREIEDPVVRDGQDFPLNTDHSRSVVQLRLHLALACPGYELPSRLDFAECLKASTLDGRAVELLSEWLAEEVTSTNRDGTTRVDKRGNAVVIGSATMPAFVRSVAARSSADHQVDYLAWRRDHFHLDRYESEGEARRQHVDRVLSGVEV